MSTDRKLTLEDVEVCIKVIVEFMKQYKRAERIMRAISRRGVEMRLGRGNLMDILLEQSLTRMSGETEEEEVELTEEDARRLEEIISKYKSSAEKT